jgi:ribosomal protein S18 acetylase RimI-like enzyme
VVNGALTKARNIGFTRVWLTVREDNKAAISLYKKVGFAIEGLQLNAIKIDDNYENRFLMALVW